MPNNNKNGGGIIAWIKGIFIHPREPEDIVSRNTKLVLFGLFALVGFAVLLYAITVTVKYDPKNEPEISGEIINQTIIDSNLTADQKALLLGKPQIIKDYGNKAISNSARIELLEDLSVQRMEAMQASFEQFEQLNAVYIACISGAIALGGTLIAQLWGRRQE